MGYLMISTLLNSVNSFWLFRQSLMDKMSLFIIIVNQCIEYAKCQSRTLHLPPSPKLHTLFSYNSVIDSDIKAPNSFESSHFSFIGSCAVCRSNCFNKILVHTIRAWGVTVTQLIPHFTNFARQCTKDRLLVPDMHMALQRWDSWHLNYENVRQIHIHLL